MNDEATEAYTNKYDKNNDQLSKADNIFRNDISPFCDFDRLWMFHLQIETNKRVWEKQVDDSDDHDDMGWTFQEIVIFVSLLVGQIWDKIVADQF